MKRYPVTPRRKNHVQDYVIGIWSGTMLALIASFSVWIAVVVTVFVAALLIDYLLFTDE